MKAIENYRIRIEDSSMLDLVDLKREIEVLTERLGKTQEYL